MSTRRWKSAVFALALPLLGLLPAIGDAAAQSNPRYIRFSPNEVKGALYVPDSGPAPKVGVLVAHRNSNYLNHLSTTELSKRGFMVLGLNTRFDNNESLVNWEKIVLDIKTGVDFLKKQPGIEKVILIASSGGGPMMTYYQAVAEKGTGYCKGDNKLTQCTDEVAGLIPADGIVLFDAHPGNTVNVLRSLNPAVLDESDPRKLDPALDPFNPANGFNPNGKSVYSAEFKAKFFKGQSDRMNRLIAKAQKTRAEMAAGQHMPSDDDAFIVYRNAARMEELDTDVYCCTEKPQKLLKNDGTIDASQIVRSVRLPNPKNAKRDGQFEDTRIATLTSFLSTNAIKSTNSFDGIDWCSSNNSVPCALKQISVPLLFTSMGAHYFIRDNELAFETAVSKDKDFIVVEGAEHRSTPCKACAAANNANYDNSTKNVFDYIAKWASARFAS